MIRMTVLYPYVPGAKFDMAYFLNTHIPLVQKRLGPALKGVTVDQGLSGAPPGTPMTYTTIVNLTFDSVEVLETAFAPHKDELIGDIPNYTALKAIFQISEVKL